MVTSICPDREDLRSFHLGMLDERRELEVLDHLNDCQSCEDTVANLEGTSDSLVAAVRSSANSEAATSDRSDREDRPALQQALAEIEAFIDSPSPSDENNEDAASLVSERIRDYELLGTLGEGGMGTVYRARHTRLDRQVALKLLPARRLRDNVAVARFEREMKAIGRLDHPTIVRATDAGDVDGTHFLAMDYVEGIDLSKLVRLIGPLDVAGACEIVRQAALGLDYAHQQELIHRDVKPSNLMLTLRGEVRILDLGLALFGAASEALDELTTVGQLMGTLDYMAPEQGDNSHDVDARADVYSLGATLFKLLTATAPYDSPGTRTPLAKMKALATIDAPSVADRRAELPTELITIVDRALLRNVEDRFASAKEVAESLLPFCEGHSLNDLAECGRNLALQEEEQIPQPPALPPFAQKAEISPSPANVTRADDLGDRSPGVGRRIAKWMLVPLILLAGIVIWIQTDSGTLVVESPSGGIPIEIRTGGKFHSSETLSIGKNDLTIRSGTYEIVLPKEYDSLNVENQVFTLKRGGQWIAKISKRLSDTATTNTPPVGRNTPPGMSPISPGPATSPATAGMLVFSGKTFEEWQRAVLTERNPAELEKAVQALCILGRGNRDAEAAKTVLRVIDGYACEINPPRVRVEAILVSSAIRHLRTLDAKSIIPEITKATTNGGINVRNLIINYLAAGVMDAYRSAVGVPSEIDIGKPQPLANELTRSEAFHEALLDIFSELESRQRLFAYNLLYNSLNSQPPNRELIQFLEACIQHSEPDDVTISAARGLAEIRPTAELAELFLNHLEGTHEALKKQNTEFEAAKWGGGSHKPKQNWWDLEASAWLGLAALGKHAAGAVDRIVELLEETPGELTEPLRLYQMSSRSSQVRAQYEVHRQLLAIEILATIGPAASGAVPTINEVLQDLTGHAPTVNGDYGFDGFFEDLILEVPVGHGLRTRKPGMGFSIPKDLKVVPDRAQRLNSAILALKRITGELPRFKVERIDANGARKVPTGMDAGYRRGGMDGGYPGGGSAGMMEGYSGEGEYSESMLKQYTPRLVTYKGKSFVEWTDLRNASPDMPLSKLRDLFRGASLLAGNPDEEKSAAAIANSAFEYAIRRPWPLTPELRDFLVTTIEASYSHDPTGVLTPIEDTLAQVTPARQAFLLNELLVPVEESKFGFRLQQRSFSRYVVANSQFPNAYNDLVENWDKHSAELREAIIQVESHLPALGRKNSVQLLTRLVKETYDAAKSDAKTSGAMTDLQMKAAFVLAATKPKNAEVQQQLDELLSGVLTHPHARRPRPVDGAEAAGLETDQSEQEQPSLRSMDANRLHAAIALKLGGGESLSAATARKFAQLIIQDTERHEVRAFRIVSPSGGSPVIKAGLGPAMMDEDGNSEISVHATPGATWYPGGGDSEAGYAPSAFGGTSNATGTEDDAGMGEGGIGSTFLVYKKKSFSREHGEFSRRVLMTRLLITMPPSDPEVQNEIGEQLAKSLLDRYPQAFLPSPPSEDADVSIYDLIEAEFRSGVRYTEQPDGQGPLEVARFVDSASAVVWNYLPDDRRIQIHQNRVAKLQAAQIAATQPKQLYDGRPFDEWLKVVSTERSPDRLIEAVNALTILGKNGRDTEAALAIMTCLASYSSATIDGQTAEGRLLLTIQERLKQLNRKSLAPVFADTILRGNSNQRKFLFKWEDAQFREWLKPGGPLLQPQFVSVLMKATHDESGAVRQFAANYLTPFVLSGEISLRSADREKLTLRLVELLNDRATQVSAAVCLSTLVPNTEGLSDILLMGIDNFTYHGSRNDTLRSIDAYWALRILLSKNPELCKGVNERLMELLEEVVDKKVFTHGTLLVELLMTTTRQTQSNSPEFVELLQDLARSAARLPKTEPKIPITSKSFGADVASYKPVLTDDYVFPLPVNHNLQGNIEVLGRTSHTAAAIWALKQLEVVDDAK